LRSSTAFAIVGIEMEERQEIMLGNRVSKRLHARLVEEQKRIAKMTGIEPTINEIVRMLIEKGLTKKK